MGRGKPIIIGDTAFPTKKAAGAAIREILYAYEIGQTVSLEHSAFLGDLLLLHPEVADKVGGGIASFQVRQNEGSRGFWLTRTDGSSTDFSFLSCLTPPLPESEARAAFRYEVQEQKFAFRDNAFSGTSWLNCPVSGIPVSATTCHVDHEIPFESLLTSFLNAVGVSLAEVKVEPTRDGDTNTRLADRILAKKWATYHRQHALLRIVSIKANLSVLRKSVPSI
jgi:hypothetical protein